MKKDHITNSPKETRKLGEFLAEEILKIRNNKKAIVLGLQGDLGGGKTTFLQGFGKTLGIRQKILSPTFVIMKKFPVKKKGSFENFYHFDYYRLSGPKEILKLGFKEITSDPLNIIAVEWADKIKKILFKETVWIKFRFINDKKRKITILWKNLPKN